jgi:chaperonin GroES
LSDIGAQVALSRRQHCGSAQKWQGAVFARRLSRPGLDQDRFIPVHFRRQRMAKSQSKETRSAGEKIQLQPLGDRVVIEREESESVTAGGIVLPDTAKDKPTRGKVISVGEGRLSKDGRRVPLQIKVGERVLFTSYAGEQFKLGDRELLLMREEDILAVIGK